MRRRLVFLIGVNAITYSYSQNSLPNVDLLINADKHAYINTFQSQKICDFFIRTNPPSIDYSDAYIIKATCFYLKDDYQNALKNVELALEHADKFKSIDKTAQANLLKVDILRFINLDNIANQLMLMIMQDYEKMSNKTQSLIDLKKSLDIAKVCVRNNNSSAGIKCLNMALRNYEKSSNELFPYIYNEGLFRLTGLYINVQDVEKALELITKIEKNFKDIDRFDYFLIQSNFTKSRIHFLKKEYKNALKYLQPAELMASNFEALSVRDKINDDFLRCYFALGMKNKLLPASRTGNQIKSQLGNNNYEATNYVFMLDKEQNLKKINKKQKDLKVKNGILISFLITISAIGATLVFINYARRNNIQNIINYLKMVQVGKNVKNNQAKIEQQKNNILLPETEQILLSKLKIFETSDMFTQKEMSLALLASHLDTNTKYLSEVINKHKEKNFNLYINELRVNYIIYKLNTDPNYLSYKISYLAEECGFSSHSNFASTFKSITGILPTVFIKLLQKEHENEITKINN